MIHEKSLKRYFYIVIFILDLIILNLHMTELFEFFEQVCMETSIPLDKEIQTVEELLQLIEDHENYIPKTKACREYKHVIDSLIRQAPENLYPVVVSELSELIFAKLKTYSINQIQYSL